MGKRNFNSFFQEILALAALAACTAACSYLLLETTGSRHPPSQSASPQPAVSMPQSSAAASVSSGNGSFVKFRDRSLVLVSPTVKMPDWYRPNLVTAFGVEMDSSTAAAYTAMHAAAAKGGISLWISSGYRSNERQGELFEQEVALYQKTYSVRSVAEAYAERSVARPGYSEHATGLALDLNGVRDDFDQTPAFRWLDTHAQEYGFILRYPKNKQEITHIKYEPWHYRYVGAKNAVAMKISGQCLEEYLQSEQKTAAVN